MKKSLLVLVSILTAPLAGAQELEGESEVPILEIRDLIVAHYAPANSHAVELYQLIRPMIGREFYVAERGGIHAESVRNLAVLGDQIVIYDTQDYVDTLLETLRKIDVVQRGAADGMEPYVTRSYVPKFITLDSAMEALSPLMRRRSGARNVSPVEDRRTIVMRDTESRVSEMEGVLRSLDLPEDQVLLRCYLLRGRKGETDTSGAPSELITHLERLLPDLGFQSTGFAMLQSGVVPGREVHMSVKGQDGLGFDLTFTPVAYDSSTGSLTARGCRVGLTYTLSSQTESLLMTDILFRGGQYTVLGATGSDPVFVVVHVEPMR